MKKIILGCLISLAVNNAFADVPKQDRATVEEACDGMAKISRAIMESRQSGGNIADDIYALNNFIKIKEPLKEYYKHVIYEAYQEPLWETEEKKKDAVNEFSNQKYLRCIKVMNSD